MADVKISALPAATTPLGGTELVPIVQGGVTTRVSVDNLTAGRTVAASTVNVDANTASAAVRITQTGAGNALVVEDEANPDSSPFVINTTGVVGIGLTNPGLFLTSGIVVRSATAFTPQHMLWNTTADANSSYWVSRKDRAGAIVSNGDAIGNFTFEAYDGATYRTPASIVAQVDGVPGSNDMAGRITFSTRPSGVAGVLQERMRITNAGRVGIGTTAPGGRLAVTHERTGGGFIQVWSSLNSGVFENDAILNFNGTTTNFGNFQLFPLAFVTNNIERMRITSIGDVGIGTTTPGGRLDVAGTSGNVQISAGGDQIGFTFNGFNYLTASGAAAVLQIQATGASGRLHFVAGGTERMRITSTGNVCIGTTAAGTSAEEVLAIGTGVAPTTGPADTIQIYSTDLSAGNTILSLFTEGTPVNANTTAATTHRIAVRINGTVYYLLANTAA